MTLNANDLILFAQVMDSGSFSAAADRLGLPKSTLSRRISGLETELGERLITRSTRKLMITEFGSEVLEHARRLVDETETTMAFALNRQATPQGTLRVSFPPDFFEHALAEFLPLFSEQHPNVRLELDLSARRVDLLAERFDAAIRVATSLPDDNSLVARRLATLVTTLYASPSYMSKHGPPKEPDDLKTHRGLMLMNSMGDIRRWRLSRGTDFWEARRPACSARTPWGCSGPWRFTAWVLAVCPNPWPGRLLKTARWCLLYQVGIYPKRLSGALRPDAVCCRQPHEHLLKYSARS